LHELYPPGIFPMNTNACRQRSARLLHQRSIPQLMFAIRHPRTVVALHTASMKAKTRCF
jgi:hypothetical protein